MDEDEIKSNGYINIEYNKSLNMISAKNIANSEFKNTMYISSSENINSYTGSKEFFIGEGNLEDPEALKKLEFDKSNTLWKNGIIAIEFNVELEALKSKEIVLVLGAEDDLIKCQDTAYKYCNLANAKSEYDNVKKYWGEETSKIQVKTPMESINILLNGWSIYQTIVSRLWARSGYYQSGGAYGFRDQLQDTIAIKYFNTDLVQEQILKHSRHQFIEGDVEHWWHEETGRGIRTKFSDDLLWLPYIVANYIEFTGDYDILKQETAYIEGKKLEEWQDESYDKYEESQIKGSIYEHCIKAIEKSLNFGINEIPKIGTGDWNDGFSEVGNKGIGESVWLGFFLYSVLDKFIPICESNQEIELANKYTEIKDKLKKMLNKIGWDGRWFRRAFTDDGKILRKFAK